MSEDSKNTFGSSVGVIQTRCKPLKVAASTVYYSIEAEKFLASKIAEMNFLLYKMMLLIPILKKLSFYLQKQKNFYSNPNCGFGDWDGLCRSYLRHFGLKLNCLFFQSSHFFTQESFPDRSMMKTQYWQKQPI